jgi:hypothetical protein
MVLMYIIVEQLFKVQMHSIIAVPGDDEDDLGFTRRSPV